MVIFLKTKLFNGECSKVLKKIKEDSVDLIVTDPPYNIANFMKRRDTNLNKMRNNFFVDAGWDCMDEEEWIIMMDVFFSMAARVMKKRGSVVMFMSILRVDKIISIAEKYGFYYKTTGIWHKSNPMPRNMNLHFVNSTETWLYFTYKSKTGTFNNFGKVLHDYIETGVCPKSEKVFGSHPTQKPEKLIEYFVQALSNEQDVVMDPFMGAGTTGVVARRLNRNFIGIELSKKYYEIAQRRIAEV